MDPTILSAGALAALATGGGAPIWAVVIQYIIETLKTFISAVSGHEKLLAFILSGVIVAGAFYTALQVTPPATTLDFVGVLLAVLAWFTVARLSMATHDDLARRPGTLFEPTADELARTDPTATISATAIEPVATSTEATPPVAGGDSP